MLWVELVGYAGVSLTLGTYLMKRMIPLRMIGVCANCLFAAYGFLTPRLPTTGTARPQLWPTTPLRN